MLLCSNALFVVLSNYRHFFLPQSSSASRFNRWGLWVLALDPIPRASRVVGRAKLHGCDAFEAKLQALAQGGGAIALDTLIEPDAGAGLNHDRRERSLADPALGAYARCTHAKRPARNTLMSVPGWPR